MGQFAVHFDTLFRRYADIQFPCLTKPLKEGPMSNPETYPRQTAYGSAILGTNNSKLIERIADARKAIEHRLSNPIEIYSREHLAIRAAWKGLVALESERVDGSV